MTVTAYFPLRQALREHLALDPDLQVVFEAADVPAALAGSRGQLVDLVLLDLSLAGSSVLEFLPDLKAQQPNAHIIAFNLEDFPALRAAALERGAEALVTNAHLGRDLLPTIRRLCGDSAPTSDDGRLS